MLLESFRKDLMLLNRPQSAPVQRVRILHSTALSNDLAKNFLVDPVEIHLPGEGQGNNIQVNNVSDEYLQMSRHPAYQKSTIVQTSATASRLIVTGSTYLANAINSGADSFQKKTKPSPKPMTFTPATHARIRKINNFSQGAVGLSAKTVGQVSRYAQNIGAGLAGKGGKKVGYDKGGNPASSYKPGILNKSMIAFSTIADGIDQAGRQLLQSGSTAATTVVGHRYGDEARSVASDIGGGVRNVGLVYIDAAGVSRKAVIKSVAKGMVVGKMQNGQHLVVGAGDGGVAPQATGPQSQGGYPLDMKHTGSSQNPYSGSSSGRPGTEPVGFGTFGTNPAPPTYASRVGESLHGQYAPEKH